MIIEQWLMAQKKCKKEILWNTIFSLQNNKFNIYTFLNWNDWFIFNPLGPSDAIMSEIMVYTGTGNARVTLYIAGHLHTAVPHCSHSRAPIVHTAVPRENNEHGCVYLRCRAVCKLPGCVEGHPCNGLLPDGTKPSLKPMLIYHQ